MRGKGRKHSGTIFRAKIPSLVDKEGEDSGLTVFVISRWDYHISHRILVL